MYPRIRNVRYCTATQIGYSTQSATYPCRAARLLGDCGRHLRIYLIGTIYPRKCRPIPRAHPLRDTVMPRLRHFNRTASDTANWLRKPRKKKSSAVPLIGAVVALRFSPDCLTRERQEFKEEGHSFNPRTAREQCLAAYGQTAGVPSFFAPAAGADIPAVCRRRIPPLLNLSEKRPARYGKRFYSRPELVQMIHDHIYYYNTQRVQRNFGVVTPMKKSQMAFAA